MKWENVCRSESSLYRPNFKTKTKNGRHSPGVWFFYNISMFVSHPWVDIDWSLGKITLFLPIPQELLIVIFFHRSPNSIQLYWTDVIQTEENKDYFKRSGPWFFSPNTIFLLKSTRTALDMFQQAPNRPISIEQIEMVLNKIVYRWSDICTIETFFFTCLINIKKFFFCSLFQSKIWWAYLCLGNVGCVARNWYRRMLSQICFRLKKKISSK